MQERKLRREFELFHAYLRQNGLKKTYQKDLILLTFLEAEGHFSVEDVYLLAKKREKRIGIVTVFRTLKSLAACGLAREITLGDGLTRFEHSYHHPQHHHVVCTNCGTTIEFLSPELERLQAEIVAKYRFQAVHHLLQIYGTCEDCRGDGKPGERGRFDTEKVFARDAVLMALSVEKRGLELYRDAAERNLDALGKAVLDQIVEEEAQHYQRLEAELEAICGKDAGIRKAPLFLHFDAERLDQLIPDLREFENNGELRLSARQALELAMMIEKRAADFFRNYAEAFLETEGKRILQRFAEEEQHHCERIGLRMEQALSAAP